MVSKGDLSQRKRLGRGTIWREDAYSLAMLWFVPFSLADCPYFISWISYDRFS